MSGKLQSLNFFVFSCLFVAAQTQRGQVLPPQNVSILWFDHVRPFLSWVQPPNLTDCEYALYIGDHKYHGEDYYTFKSREKSPTIIDVVMERGFLQWSFKTVCSNAATQSKPVNGSVSFPEVVKYVDCYIYSDTQAYCNWKTIIDTPDLQFFYQLKDQSKTEGSIWSPLLECSSYNFTDSQNPGCHLQANFLNDVYILFNGTLNETLFRNTFKRLLEARPPALTVLVTKSGTKLNISWTHPAVSVLDWKFTIKYNECKEEKSITVNERTSHMLELVPHCPYHIAVQAKHDRGKTPWSEWTHFGPEEGANTWLYAAIIIPLTAALLAVLAFVCWSRNKDKIFPKIPKPVDLISDISENNNKDTVCRLYVQAEEEENCKIALVIDP